MIFIKSTVYSIWNWYYYSTTNTGNTSAMLHTIFLIITNFHFLLLKLRRSRMLIHMKFHMTFPEKFCKNSSWSDISHGIAYEIFHIILLIEFHIHFIWKLLIIFSGSLHPNIKVKFFSEISYEIYHLTIGNVIGNFIGNDIGKFHMNGSSAPSYKTVIML